MSMQEQFQAALDNKREAEAEFQPDRILRRREIEHLTSLTERQLRNLEAEGAYPKRFLITPNGRSVGWQGGRGDHQEGSGKETPS